MSILKKLYNGKICPAGRNPFLNSQYEKAMQEYTALYDEFIKDLPVQKVKQLNRMLEANTNSFVVLEDETFEIGFCLGARIMECINKSDL